MSTKLWYYIYSHAKSQHRFVNIKFAQAGYMLTQTKTLYTQTKQQCIALSANKASSGFFYPMDHKKSDEKSRPMRVIGSFQFHTASMEAVYFFLNTIRFILKKKN